MGPAAPDHRRDQSSSGSDEESNSRHDRFRSERFQEQHSSRIGQFKEEDYKLSSKRSSKPTRYRERSPRSYRHKETSTFNCRNESRSNHDRKEREKKYHSKSSTHYRCQRSISDQKPYGKAQKQDSTSKHKKNLSSLLKNFDQQTESKRNSSESSMQSEIGPVLPPHLQPSLEHDSKKPVSSKCGDAIQVDPTLAPCVTGAGENLDAKSEKNSSVQDTSEFVVALPPHFEKKLTELENDVNIRYTESTNLLPRRQCSEEKTETDDHKNTPTNKSTKDENSKTSSDISTAISQDLTPKSQPEAYGPTLPPKIELNSYGPALPPNFKQVAVEGSALLPENSLPTEEEQNDSDDDDIVGPLPEGKMSMTQYQLDLRALHIKRKLQEEKNGSSKDEKKREEWMLELPPEKAANLGLGPRNFRMRAAPDMSRRSEWTDTPADKLRKEEQAQRGEVEPVSNDEMARTAFVRERNEVMDSISKQSKDESAQKSLLELHQKKLKKKKKKEEKDGKKKERRPFDRNIDLQVHRFDDAQKKAIFKKAQLLDTRFSSGESKYL